MIGAPVAFPELEVPPGWTREVHGPRLWLVPDEPGGRIVVPPVQPRPRWLHAEVFLEHVLLQERERQFKRAAPIAITSRDGAPGICVDVAAVDRAGEAIEWRTYAMFILEPQRRQLALLFLQCAPPRFAALRPVFHALAATVRAPAPSPSVGPR